MLTIRIVAVGFLTDYYQAAVSEYSKRLSKFCKFEIIQIKESDKRKECEAIRERVKGHIILCSPAGALISSEELAGSIEKLSQVTSTITFIIGGSDGVGDLLNDVVNDKISFGRITLPHQLFRVVLTEQIYRAFTILNGVKYHK